MLTIGLSFKKNLVDIIREYGECLHMAVEIIISTTKVGLKERIKWVRINRAFESYDLSDQVCGI